MSFTIWDQTRDMFIIQETMALQVASIMEKQFYRGQLIRKKNPDKWLLIVN